MAIQPVDKWIICFSGYGQTDKFHTGISSLEDASYRTCASPTVRVELHGWQADIDYLADRITDRPIGINNPVVIIIAYSWGVATALDLIEELRRRGYDVAILFSSDGISRGPIPWLSFRSLLGPQITLIIPDNVLRVGIWRQKTPGLRNLQGSRIILQDADKTKYIQPPSISSTTTHSSMDENKDFRRLALEFSCPQMAQTLRNP